MYPNYNNVFLKKSTVKQTDMTITYRFPLSNLKSYFILNIISTLIYTSLSDIQSFPRTFIPLSSKSKCACICHYLFVSDSFFCLCTKHTICRPSTYFLYSDMKIFSAIRRSKMFVNKMRGCVLMLILHIPFYHLEIAN